MTERFRQVTPLKVEYICDECGQAALEVSGPPLPNGKIPHYCPSCSALVALDRGYPMIRFDDIAADQMPIRGNGELHMQAEGAGPNPFYQGEDRG